MGALGVAVAFGFVVCVGETMLSFAVTPDKWEPAVVQVQVRPLLPRVEERLDHPAWMRRWGRRQMKEKVVVTQIFCKSQYDYNHVQTCKIFVHNNLSLLLLSGAETVVSIAYSKYL